MVARRSCKEGDHWSSSCQARGERRVAPSRRCLGTLQSGCSQTRLEAEPDGKEIPTFVCDLNLVFAFYIIYLSNICFLFFPSTLKLEKAIICEWTFNRVLLNPDV